MDRIRNGYEAFFRGDVDTTVEILHPDVLGVDPPDMPDTGSYRGREPFKQRLLSFLELFDDVTLRELRTESLGDRVLVLLSIDARARGGGLPVEVRLAYALELDDDGLATDVHVFFTEDEARAYLANR